MAEVVAAALGRDLDQVASTAGRGCPASGRSPRSESSPPVRDVVGEHIGVLRHPGRAARAGTPALTTRHLRARGVARCPVHRGASAGAYSMRTSSASGDGRHAIVRFKTDTIVVRRARGLRRRRVLGTPWARSAAGRRRVPLSTPCCWRRRCRQDRRRQLNHRCHAETAGTARPSRASS